MAVASVVLKLESIPVALWWRSFAARRGFAFRMNIVADGQQKAWSALEPVIRAEVEEGYTDEWNRSGLFRRWLLQRKIDAEVQKRLEAAAPTQALY